jgi:hypothetical protein
MHLAGVSRRGLQILAASPFVGAFLGMLLDPLVNPGQSGQITSWPVHCVVVGAVSGFLVCAGWIAVWHIGQFRKQAHRLRLMTSPPYSPRANPLRVQGAENITRCLDELTEVVAVKFLPCELQPKERTTAFEDWSEILEAEHHDDAYLIVPLATLIRTRHTTRPGLVELLPRNPFAVVMMTIDRGEHIDASFSEASDRPFCSKVMRLLRECKG